MVEQELHDVSALSLSLLVLLMVSIMSIHTMIWCWHRYKNSDEFSIPIFLTSILCFSFFVVYSANWSLVIMWDLYFSKNGFENIGKYICIYDLCNNSIYIIGKALMFLFFFARLYDIFDGSVYKVNKKTLYILGISCFTFFLAVTIDFIYDISTEYIEDSTTQSHIVHSADSNDDTITALSDCQTFSTAFAHTHFDYSFLNVSLICIIGELIISAILLRMLVSRLIKLYIRQKLGKIENESIQLARKNKNMIPTPNRNRGVRIPNSNREKFVLDAWTLATLDEKCAVTNVCNMVLLR